MNFNLKLKKIRTFRKMAQALDVNPYTLYDTAGRDASEMMELLFWLDEFNPSALHLFLPKKFPGEKCNEVADISVYYHDNDNCPQTCDGCGKYEPKKQWLSVRSKLSET